MVRLSPAAGLEKGRLEPSARGRLSSVGLAGVRFESLATARLPPVAGLEKVRLEPSVRDRRSSAGFAGDWFEPLAMECFSFAGLEKVRFESLAGEGFPLVGLAEERLGSLAAVRLPAVGFTGGCLESSVPDRFSLFDLAGTLLLDGSATECFALVDFAEGSLEFLISVRLAFAGFSAMRLESSVADRFSLFDLAGTSRVGDAARGRFSFADFAVGRSSESLAVVRLVPTDFAGV